MVLIKKCDALLYLCEVREAVTQPDVEAQIRLNCALLLSDFYFILKYSKTGRASRGELNNSL